MRNVPFPKAMEINSHHSWTERPNCILSPRWTPNFLINMTSREGEPRIALLKRALHGRSARASHARTHAFRKHTLARARTFQRRRRFSYRGRVVTNSDRGRRSASTSRPERLTIGQPARRALLTGFMYLCLSR